MPAVENDSEEEVDYSYNEGQGTSGISLFRHLGPGDVDTLRVANQHFDIYFYKRDDRLEPFAYRREVPRDSDVRLHNPNPDRWEVEVRPSENGASA